MFTDPLAVTYDGSAKSLPRVSASTNGTVYRTADSTFEIRISNGGKPRDGIARRSISLSRKIPDPTPSDVFDNVYREIRNGFVITYFFDAETRAEVSVDIPLLRTSLLNHVDTTFQSRLLSGEM